MPECQRGCHKITEYVEYIRQSTPSQPPHLPDPRIKNKKEKNSKVGSIGKLFSRVKTDIVTSNIKYKKSARC